MEEIGIKQLKKAQQGELDAVYMYNKLSKKVKLDKDKELFKQLAMEEGRHAQVFHNITKIVLRPKKLLGNFVSMVYLIVGRKILYKIISNSEYGASKNYEAFIDKYPEVEQVKNDENRHGDLVKSLLE